VLVTERAERGNEDDGVASERWPEPVELGSYPSTNVGKLRQPGLTGSRCTLPLTMPRSHSECIFEERCIFPRTSSCGSVDLVYYRLHERALARREHLACSLGGLLSHCRKVQAVASFHPSIKPMGSSHTSGNNTRHNIPKSGSQPLNMRPVVVDRTR